MKSPVQLDVRPMLAAGREPFPEIRRRLAGLEPGQALLLISPFIPSPLIELLQNQGFTARPTMRRDGAWETVFTPPGP